MRGVHWISAGLCFAASLADLIVGAPPLLSLGFTTAGVFYVAAARGAR